MMTTTIMISILASILLAVFNHARLEAAAAASKAQLQEIANGTEMYYTDNLTYPTGTGVDVNGTLFGGANNKYFTGEPKDPIVGTDYIYTNPSANGAPYEIDAPGTYDSSTLQTLSKVNGTTCGTTCTQLHYDNVHGIYGS